MPSRFGHNVNALPAVGVLPIVDNIQYHEFTFGLLPRSIPSYVLFLLWLLIVLASNVRLHPVLFFVFNGQIWPRDSVGEPDLLVTRIKYHTSLHGQVCIDG